MHNKLVKVGPGEAEGRVRLAATTGSHRGVMPRSRLRRRVATVVAAGSLLTLVGCSAPLHGASSKGKSTSLPFSDPTIEALYTQDLVARINAERAARSTAGVLVPQLEVDPGLQADAQAWSAQLAATGTVADPTLPPCAGGGTQVCALAANSGDSGNGFWPGDGSDGMNGDYMLSAPHRQNELGAAYTSVGVGVTCGGNQAWTVEVFGYSPNILPSASARESAQNAVEGDPVPQNPIMAGAPSGDPVYCPGQTDGPNGEVSTGGQVPYPYAVPGVPGEPGGGMAAVEGIASTPDAGGYWLARADGSISAHGDAVSYGSMAGVTLVAPVSHVVSTPDGKGYWLVASDGGIFAFGDAGFFGSMGGKRLNAPVVDLAPTADGKGYWLVARDGGIFAFGDATFRGSMGGSHLRAPVVGMAPDTATGGYWLVGSDGGIFAMDAPFLGSTGAITLNQPVNGMAATSDGNGYWLVADDGAVFAFGDAGFHGSTGGMTLNAPVVGMTADTATGGYWLAGGDGGVFAFGAPFHGSG